MAHCSDCNKFVSLNSDEEPDVSLDVMSDGQVTGNVQIVNTCESCGTIIRSADFDVEMNTSEFTADTGYTLEAYIKSLDGKDCSLEYEIAAPNGAERTMRTEGKGRSTKTFYGASMELTLTVTMTPKEGNPTVNIFSGDWKDDIQASHMDGP
jgi:hypothetical protein